MADMDDILDGKLDAKTGPYAFLNPPPIPLVTTATVSIDGATVTLSHSREKGWTLGEVYNLFRQASLGVGFSPFSVDRFLPRRD